MRHPMLCTAIFSLMLASEATAADNYSVLGGFIGIVKTDLPNGVIRSAPVKHWGTDDRQVTVVVTLAAIGPDGKRVCDVTNEFTRPLGEPVLPVAFNLLYQNAPREPVPIRVQNATYKLISTVQWRELPPSNKQGSRTTEYPASFPMGGTPSCTKKAL